VADKQLVIEPLWKVIADPKSKVLDRTRAADTLGRLADYSWFSKPQDPAPTETVIDTDTAKRIMDLSERLLGTCPHCGGTLSGD